MNEQVLTAGVSGTFTEPVDRDVFISLLATEAMSVPDMLLMKAPITGVEFSNNVDYSLQRSFSDDWILCSFGFRPIEIMLSGVELLASACKGLSIQSFYDKYNVRSNPSARLMVGISGGEADGALNAVLVSLTRIYRPVQEFSLNSTYKMGLVAVKL